MKFEWDQNKAKRNLRKHKVPFAEAATVPDPDHSEEENRQITVGASNRHRLLIVSHSDRGSCVRIISARQLTRSERQAYEEESKR